MGPSTSPSTPSGHRRPTNSFAYLARKGFYDGLDFQRIVPGFVIQGGDPLGNGTGGPGYSIDEKPPSNLAYTTGVVAMAKTAVEPPGRSGSQFFVVLAADAGLSPDYALVGRVDRGMDVVERIGSLGTPARAADADGADRPHHDRAWLTSRPSMQSCSISMASSMSRGSYFPAPMTR